MEKNENHNTVIVYTYRYIWKTVKGKLCVKFLTGPQEEHITFQQSIKDDVSIESCLREYVCEVNFAYLGFTEEVKKKNDNKEVKNDEEKVGIGH